MPFSRPLREYMIWIGKFWESPRLENKTCVGTVDDFPQGLNQADEYKGVLGPGLWRFVAASLTFPLRVARICRRWDPCDVWLWGTVRVPLFLSVPYLVGKFKITVSLLVPLVAWCDSGGSCHGQRNAALTEVPPPHRDADRHGGTASAKTPLSVAVLLQTWEMPYLTSRALDQGLGCECSLWSAVAWSASKSTFERPSRSGLMWVLTSLPADTMDVLSLPDWTCSSYRLCSIRVQISFALFSFRKKAFCFVYPCKCQKCKILKSLPKKLLSFKKRAIYIVILLSYCLMNLLAPRFSARKWVLSFLKQGEFFPFIKCSISSYQSHG